MKNNLSLSIFGGIAILGSGCNPEPNDKSTQNKICQKEVTQLLDSARVDFAPEVNIAGRICDSQKSLEKVLDIKNMPEDKCRESVVETMGSVIKSDLDDIKNRICHGSHNQPILKVDYDGDEHTGEDDCDDTNKNVYKDATELCDGIDDDCDGENARRRYAREGRLMYEFEFDVNTYSWDEDGDGFPGTIQRPDLAQFCDPIKENGDTVVFKGEKFSVYPPDCNDHDINTNPYEVENPLQRDGIDNDCDGNVDFGIPSAPGAISDIVIYEKSLGNDLIGDPNCKWIRDLSDIRGLGVQLKDPSPANIMACYQEDDRGGVDKLLEVIMATKWFYHGDDSSPSNELNTSFKSDTNLCAQDWDKNYYNGLQNDEWNGCTVDEIEKLFGEILSNDSKAEALYPMIKAGLLANDVRVEDLEYVANYLRNYDLEAETKFYETACLTSTDVSDKMCDHSIGFTPEGYNRIEWEKLSAEASEKDSKFVMPRPSEQAAYADFLFEHLKNKHITAQELLPWVDRLIIDLKKSKK